MWDDDPYYFNMSVTPLMIDFNVLRVEVGSTEDDRQRVFLKPKSDWPPFRMIETKEDPGVTRKPFEEEIQVRGLRTPGAGQPSPDDARPRQMGCKCLPADAN